MKKFILPAWHVVAKLVVAAALSLQLQLAKQEKQRTPLVERQDSVVPNTPKSKDKKRAKEDHSNEYETPSKDQMLYDKYSISSSQSKRGSRKLFDKQEQKENSVPRADDYDDAEDLIPKTPSVNSKGYVKKPKSNVRLV